MTCTASVTLLVARSHIRACWCHNRISQRQKSGRIQQLESRCSSSRSTGFHLQAAQKYRQQQNVLTGLIIPLLRQRYSLSPLYNSMLSLCIRPLTPLTPHPKLTEAHSPLFSSEGHSPSPATAAASYSTTTSHHSTDDTMLSSNLSTSTHRST